MAEMEFFYFLKEEHYVVESAFHVTKYLLPTCLLILQMSQMMLLLFLVQNVTFPNPSPPPLPKVVNSIRMENNVVNY